MGSELRLDLKTARRITLAAQGLDVGHRTKTVMEAARLLNCIQFDPLNVIARTQLLVLYSRLGAFDPAELDRALFEDRQLFHYWAHAASFVLTDDFPLYQRTMKSWPGNSDWAVRVKKWMSDNDKLRRTILRGLKRNGTMLARDFDDTGSVGWTSTGWTEGQQVTRMLDFLWIQGKVMIAGRQGIQRVWAHADDWFPDWTPRHTVSKTAEVDNITSRSLRALGVATTKHVAHHFVTVPVAQTRTSLERLRKRGDIVDVEVDGIKGPWFMHRDDLHLIDEVKAGWRVPTTPLSPFDNLIRDRQRTKVLFDLDFTIEIYVPAAKRRYGYYVLPIVDGDRIVALADPKLDRKSQLLTINALHATEGFETNTAVAKRVHQSLWKLGKWLGATDITYPKAPSAWRKVLPK